MSTTIVSQSLNQHKPQLPPGNALNEFYGVPELFGKTLVYVSGVFRYDLTFWTTTCPFCGCQNVEGWSGRYGEQEMGVTVCVDCGRITDAY